MKKIKQILLSGLAVLALTACSDLDLEPKGQMDDSVLLGSESGVKSYLVLAYQMLPIEDFNYQFSSPGYGFGGGNKWDIVKRYQSTVCGEYVGERGGVDDAGGFGYWPYDRIRHINNLIEKLPNYSANYNTDTYNALMGEARFLRAFYYFGLAKRYGGIPLVTTVQDPAAPKEELRVSRATELDTWQFIHDELEFAMVNMVEESAPGEIGRGNRYVAAALMSRAMLYAGSIAKYGSYTTASTAPAAKAGLVGIPADKADYFFTESLKASQMIMNKSSNPYELVGENLPYDQKEQSYVDLFLTINKEDIFVKQYSQSANQNVQLYHSYDGGASPSDGMANWPGSQFYPSLETIELFQKLPLEDAAGKPRRFNTREELWQTTDFEPRLLANVYFSGQTLRGTQFDIKRGVYKAYTGTMRDAEFGDINAPSGINKNNNRAIGGSRLQKWKDINKSDGRETWGLDPETDITGRHGAWGGHENNTLTGAYVRKYVDYNLTQSAAAANSCYHPWKVFRFAEILLNAAEAAYELNQKDLAYSLIHRIRNRAGATAWTPKASPAATFVINGTTVDENLEFIREERARELLAENHRWFDIRRWRVADQISRLDGGDAPDAVTGIKGFTFALQNYRPHAFYPYYVVDENKWIFIREYTNDWKQFNFNVQSYYEPIPGGQMNLNPNLINNPLY